MLLEAVYHRPKQNWAYAYDDKTLHIRLRTPMFIIAKRRAQFTYAPPPAFFVNPLNSPASPRVPLTHEGFAQIHVRTVARAPHTRSPFHCIATYDLCEYRDHK